MSAAQVRGLRALAEPIAARFACDLEDVTIRQAGKRRLVRVILDHEGGLPLDLVAEVSRAISRALDDSDVLGNAPFVLEVTSPGVDRPLRLPRHWARAVGRLVTVTTSDGARLEGRILAADDDGAQLGTGSGVHRLAFAEIARAVVQVELKRVDEVALDDGPDDEPDDDTGAEPEPDTGAEPLGDEPRDQEQEG